MARERPGAVYLAAVLAVTTRKDCGVQHLRARRAGRGDTSIPATSGKLLRFAARLAPPSCAEKLFVAGRRSMGIAGSIVDQPFFESYLGMRVESVDMSEFIRRIEEKIYDEGIQARLCLDASNCPEGKDWNSPKSQHDGRARTGNGKRW